MAYKPQPIQEEAGEKKVPIQDLSMRELMELMLAELRLVRRHLAAISGEELEKEESDEDS